MEEEREPRIGVSWIQVAGSALAAVSSAVLLSVLGVAGTVIGAAVGSVVATIGTALYTRTLDASRQQVAAQAAALRRVTRAREDLDAAVATVARGGTPRSTDIARVSHELDRAEEALAGVVPAPASQPDPEPTSAPGTEPDTEPERPTFDQPGALPVPQPAGLSLLGGLSWRRVAVLTAGVFVVAMVAISAFELLTGRAVSVYTGGSDPTTGSTVPGLGQADRSTPGPAGTTPDDEGPDGEGPEGAEPDEDGSPGADPSDDPAPSSASETSGTPTDGATSTPTPGATPEPSLDPTPSPSPGLTGTASTTPTPAP